MKAAILSNVIVALVILTLPVHSQPAFRLCDPVTGNQNQITVGVLPQVELISVVQTISRYPEFFGFLMAKDSTAYSREVLTHFGPYRSHPAVAMFNRLSLQPRMLNFSAPSNIMLFTDEYLYLRNDIVTDTFVTDRAGGHDSLMVFLRLMRDFAVQSSFNGFFTRHSNFYRTLVENTINSTGPADYIAGLEEFYGSRQKSYNIVLVTLYGSVGYGNSLLYPDGKRDIYNTMGPRSVKADIPYFGDEEYLTHMIRHEFSHPYINPLTEKYWDLIKGCSASYELIPEVARKNVCGDWQECINEFVIRAITTYLAYGDSDEAGEKAYTRESGRGVSCLDELLKNIRLYESERNSFPTFESFYPRLLEVFRNIE